MNNKQLLILAFASVASPVRAATCDSSVAPNKKCSICNPTYLTVDIFCDQSAVKGQPNCPDGMDICTASCRCCGISIAHASCTHNNPAVGCTPSACGSCTGVVIGTRQELNPSRYDCDVGVLRSGNCLSTETEACVHGGGRDGDGEFKSVCTQ